MRGTLPQPVAKRAHILVVEQFSRRAVDFDRSATATRFS
jgi:hypothetical protein